MQLSCMATYDELPARVFPFVEKSDCLAAVLAVEQLAVHKSNYPSDEAPFY